MKVYLVWYYDKLTKRDCLLDIYQSSEDALERKKKEEKVLEKYARRLKADITIEARYVLL